MNNNDILACFDDDACDFLAIQLQTVQEMDSCLILKLKGQIDTYSAPFFQKSARKAVDAGFLRLIFVLKDVDYVSSKAVGTFVQIQKAATDKGGQIAMVDVHRRVMEVFRNLSMEKFLCCADSMEEAISQMKSDKKTRTFSEAIQCPTCKRKLKVAKSGRFRCPECTAVLSIDETGMVCLGNA